MAVPQEFVKIVVLMNVEGLPDEQKAGIIGLYLQQLEFLRPEIFERWNNPATDPITIPSEWKYIVRRTHRSATVSVLQSLSAYAQSLGLNLVATQLNDRTATPLPTKFIDRNQRMVNSLFRGLIPMHRAAIVLEMMSGIGRFYALLNFMESFLNEQPDVELHLHELEEYIAEFRMQQGRVMRIQVQYPPNIDEKAITALANDATWEKYKEQLKEIVKTIKETKLAQVVSDKSEELDLVLILMGHHIFAELKKYSDESQEETNYYKTLKPRLENLADFMGISRKEAAPLDKDYKSDNQQLLDDKNKSDALPDYECELTTCVMDNPVKLPSGHYVDKRAVDGILFRGCLNAADPFSREVITRDMLTIDIAKRDEINNAMESTLRPVVTMTNAG